MGEDATNSANFFCAVSGSSENLRLIPIGPDSDFKLAFWLGHPNDFSTI